MKYINLNDFQAKSLIDAKQAYEALRIARKESRSYEGSMHWKSVSGNDYLIKSVRGVQRGLGPRSPKAEELYQAFVVGKAAAEDRIKGALSRLAEQGRVCKAAGINRVPAAPANILRMLDTHGLLGKNLIVIGTNSLYAYESAAGVLFDSAIMATSDIALMLDARQKLKVAAQVRISEGGLMALLKKADSSFVPVYERGFRAVNRDGYFVDLVKAEPSPIKSLNWLLSSPKFTELAIGSDGIPVPIACPDPRAYAVQKLWLSSQPNRDPLKKGRDRAQALAVASVVLEKLPHLSFSADEMRSFPREIAGSAPENDLAELARSFGIDI